MAENDTIIVAEETPEQYKLMRENEITKILKLRLILKEIKSCSTDEMNFSDTEQVKDALKLLTIEEYLQNWNDNSKNCLDLSEIRSVDLTYTERKAVMQLVITKLEKMLHPIVGFGQRLQKEFPHIFLQKNLAGSLNITSGNTSKTPLKEKLLLLETERRQNTEELHAMRRKKLAYLKKIAELKLGPSCEYDLETALTEARLHLVKATLLQHLIIYRFVTTTPHTVEAIQEVESYINEMLNDMQQKK